MGTANLNSRVTTRICGATDEGLGKGISSAVRLSDQPISHHPAELDHLNLLRTLHPVVPPAHNDVALLRIMPMLREIPALIFRLNPHPLPPARLDLALGLDVRIP